MYFHPLFLFEIEGLVTMKFRVVIPKFHGKCSIRADHRFTRVREPVNYELAMKIDKRIDSES